MPPEKQRRRKWVVVAVVALLMGLGSAIFLWISWPPDFALEPYGNKVIAPPATLAGKVKERVRLWMRAGGLVPAGNILTEAKIITLEVPVNPGLLALLTNSPFHETREVQGWVLDRTFAEDWWSRFQESSEATVVAQPRLQTTSHQAGAMFTGGSTYIDGTNLVDYGLQIAALPIIRRKGVALTLDAANSEVVVIEPPPSQTGAVPRSVIRTNIAFTTELLLPADKVLFVLGKPQGTQAVTHALLISARIETGK